MDAVERILYYVLLSSSTLTFLVAPLAVICAHKCLRKVHRNLRLLCFALAITWCIFPIGGVLSTQCVLAYDSVTLSYQSTYYLVTKNILSANGHLFRLFETSICLERVVATVYSGTYEKNRHFHWVAPLFILMSLIFATSFAFLFNLGMFFF